MTLPAPGKNDSDNWEIYAELEAKDKKVAAEFHEKYLSKLAKRKLS